VETLESGRTVVRLAGEADVTTRALAEVLSVEASKKPRVLLVDVSELSYVDSAALHELVLAHRRLKANGDLLALVGANGAVARILQLSALDQVLPIYANAEDAGAQ
jgi:anti-sigma B factor antagonist